MAQKIPKQYLALAGHAVLSHTLNALNAYPFAGILVVLAPNDVHWRGIQSAHLSVKTAVGGDSRAVSVCRGLQALHADAADDDLVLVHDAARPCIRAKVIWQVIEAAEQHKEGAVVASPVTDALVRVVDGQCEKNISRSHIWHVQTPQVFRFGPLKHALQQTLQAGVVVADEASAMLRVGVQARIVRGDKDNLKITFQEDIAMAEFVLGALCV
jgi:2-C-methyl-D-erythritol 4-phosphate cytidylyltransferase